MKTECSYCRQHYSLDDHYEGQMLDCPQCGHKFIAVQLEEGSKFIPPEEFVFQHKKALSFSDVMEWLPRSVDKIIGSLKKDAVARFLGNACKVISKSNIGVNILYALLFIIYCLKNALVCTTFKDSSSGLYLGIAALAVIFIIVNSYLIYKTNGIFEKIIISSPSKISSVNIFTIMTFIYILLALLSFGAGIYFAVILKMFLLFIAGTAAMVLFLIFALYNAVPEHFSISEDATASAGEDFVAILTFSYKVFLRIVPIIIFLLPIAGGFMCAGELFTSYVETFGDKAMLNTMEMFSKTSILGLFLLTGFIPLVAYFNYLINYIVLDIIRAILNLPRIISGSEK